MHPCRLTQEVKKIFALTDPLAHRCFTLVGVVGAAEANKAAMGKVYRKNVKDLVMICWKWECVLWGEDLTWTLKVFMVEDSLGVCRWEEVMVACVQLRRIWVPRTILVYVVIKGSDHNLLWTAQTGYPSAVTKRCDFSPTTVCLDTTKIMQYILFVVLRWVSSSRTVVLTCVRTLGYHRPIQASKCQLVKLCMPVKLGQGLVCYGSDLLSRYSHILFNGIKEVR